MPAVGAISPTSGLKEKDVTLRIAKAIRDELLKSGRVRVALTREDDRFLVLQERYGVARKLKADLFISIHCDSVGAGDASGASVYTLSEVASDKEAAKLAARDQDVSSRIVYSAALIELDEAHVWAIGPGHDLEQQTTRVRKVLTRVAWNGTRPIVSEVARAWAGGVDDQGTVTLGPFGVAVVKLEREGA